MDSDVTLALDQSANKITFEPHPRSKRRHMPFTDLTGLRVERLVVLGYAGKRDRKFSWWCRCDCGATTVVPATSLLHAGIKSCGCLSRDTTRDRNYKHGLTFTKEYMLWASMLDRCRNPNNKKYADYGGRGITVCEQWQHDAAAFIQYVGQRPSPNFTIERIDNNRGYEPGNVRWATRREQARNRRVTKLITFGDKTMLLGDWAESLGIPYGTLQQRLGAYGWSVERALTTPVGPSHRGRRCP